MTENTTEAPDEGAGEPVEAPADAKSADATGYAVYDRTIGQYVTPVTSGKPSADEVKAAVPEGHSYKIVRV